MKNTFVVGAGTMQLGANHPMGPLHLADLVGIDVLLYICDVLFEETHDPKFRVCCLLRRKARPQDRRGLFYIPLGRRMTGRAKSVIRMEGRRA